MAEVGLDGDSSALLPHEPAKEPAQQPEPAPEPRAWLRFAVTGVGCSLAAGIVPGQTLFTELFARAGVFQGLCPNQHDIPCDEQFLEMAEMLNVASFTILSAGVVFGGAFDRWGAQICATVGSLWVAVSFAALGSLLALLPLLPEANSLLSGLVVVAILSADMGAWLNSYAMMGFMWHFPRHQALVLSLLNCTYLVGAFFAMIVEWMMNTFGVSLAVPLFAWAGTQVLVTGILWLTVPSQAEFYQRAELALGIKLPDPPTELAPWSKIRAAWAILRLDWVPHLFLAFSFMFTTAYGYFYFSMAVPIATALFGTKDAGKQLGDLCTLANGVVGMVAGPGMGFMVDMCGLGSLLAAQVFFIVVFTATFWHASWGSAATAVTSNIAFTGAAYLYYNRWFVYFATPSRIGTVVGLFSLMASSMSLLISTALIGWSGALPYGLGRFAWPLAACGTLALLAQAWFAFRTSRANPCPAAPHLLPEDEEELARTWGCKDLDELGRLLGIESRPELVGRLSTTDPDKMRALVALAAKGGGGELDAA